MTRIGYDACNGNNLPSGQFVMSYCDGLCANNRNDRARISSVQSNCGNIGDCEPGNGTVDGWVDWIVMRRKAGVQPTIYCMDDGYGGSFFDGFRHADVVARCNARGVPVPYFWVAHPNGNQSVPSYAVATQYAYPGPYDISIIPGVWPGVDGPAPPPPTPTPTPTPVEDVTGTVMTGAIWLDWNQLTTVTGTSNPVPGIKVSYNQAKYYEGTWFDRILRADGSQGDWCLSDQYVNTGGTNPSDYAFVTKYNWPPPPTPQPPKPPPVTQVNGTVMRGAIWLDWNTLSTIAVPPPAPGIRVSYNEAKKVNGVWFDRILKGNGAEGDWCLSDTYVNTGGTNPSDYPGIVTIV